MRRHLGDRLTPVAGSLELAPLELMAVSPVASTGGFGRDFWHLYSVHGRTLGRFWDRQEVASLLQRCVAMLESADSSPYETWLDAISVSGRNGPHLVDPQVLNSPAGLMRAVRRGTLRLDEPMFTNLAPPSGQQPPDRLHLHLIDPRFGATGPEPTEPTALSQAEIAWNLAKMAWLAAIRLWSDDADPTEHCQSVLDSIGRALSTVDGGWRHHSAESLTAWLVRHG